MQSFASRTQDRTSLRCTPYTSSGSDSWNDVGHQVSADPPDYTRVDISHLKEGWHLRVPGAPVDIDDIGHPPIIGISAAADDRHPCLDRQEHRRQLPFFTLKRDNGMVNRHTFTASTSVLAVVGLSWQPGRGKS